MKKVLSLLLVLVLSLTFCPVTAQAAVDITGTWYTDLVMPAADLGVNAPDAVLRATLIFTNAGTVAVSWKAVDLSAFRIFFHDMFVNAYYAVAYGAGITNINEIEAFCMESTGMSVSAYMDTLVTKEAIEAAFTPAGDTGIYSMENGQLFLQLSLMGIDSNPAIGNTFSRQDNILSFSGTSFGKPNYTFICHNIANAREDEFPLTTEPVEPSQKAILKVWAPESDHHDEDSWLGTMMRRFEQAHPEYSITWDMGVCHAGDAATLVTRDPKNAADVYIFANDQLGTLVDAGCLTPVQPSSASQTALNAITHTDNQIYGFHMTPNTWFMFYDKSVYSESDIRSLNTMLEKGTVSFPLNNSWYTAAFLFGAGGTLFGAEGNNPNAGVQLTSDACVNAAKFMVDFANHPNFVNDQDGIGVEGMIRGNIHAVFSGTWDAARLYEALGNDLGIAVLPTFTTNGTAYQMKAFAGSQALGVNPHADNLPLATEFAVFLATPESRQLRAELSNEYHYPIANALISTVNTVMETTSVVQPTIPEMANYWDPMRTFGENILNGNITKENVAEALRSTSNQIAGHS